MPQTTFPTSTDFLQAPFGRIEPGALQLQAACGVEKIWLFAGIGAFSAT
ncbi:hypothetical protein [Chlorobium sp. N1]|nr:hypothetical protein [Chlorobium sp. N1]